METFEAVMQYVFGGAAGMVIVMLILTFLRIADQRRRHREMGRWRRELENRSIEPIVGLAEPPREKRTRFTVDQFEYTGETVEAWGEVELCNGWLRLGTDDPVLCEKRLGHGLGTLHAAPGLMWTDSGVFSRADGREGGVGVAGRGDPDALPCCQPNPETMADSCTKPAGHDGGHLGVLGEEWE